VRLSEPSYAGPVTQPTRVIYLPPGVTAASQAATPSPISSIPFDRGFFESVLPPAIDAFCKQSDCTVPIVELTTVDGFSHFVNGISGASESWVALHTSRTDHEQPVQVFIPYQTIFRVEIHAEPDERRHRLGFISSPQG
jgi:hypothetical protein